ncbi:adenylate/guanylate cyclase domain-containing protein [Aeromicrobium phragmitis]|uniref:Adenylate/guanylate cyclase domain-containing protein n=1 Tax=Aeromicrobium phragmitis TaxID=2478914 RepID=A0A3L8PIP3_9ACTN|nr:adenylate/guanylate cyclase domain-containing protein [Aeromicrobium phragmitis]RLV55101.1 adenylate/guanylate cyclase domain-containing protein [Aeromicrobium phragmitis]
MGRAEARTFGSRLLGPPDQSPRQLRVRVQLLLTTLLVVTNLIGAAIVVVLSTLVIPGPAATRGTVVAIAIAAPVYISMAILGGIAWGTLRTLRALRWAIRDEPASPRDRQRALRAPWELTLMQAVLWLGGTVLFTLLAVVIQPERAMTTGFTVAIATFVVSAIAYLFSEFALRPVAARALASGEATQARLGVASRMLVFWILGTGVPVFGLLVVALLSLVVEDVDTATLTAAVFVIGTVVLVFGFFVTWLNARAVVAPIRTVRDALRLVQDGDYGMEIPVYDGTELGSLQVGFNEMAQGLRERERLRDVFGRHVGREVADAALAEIELGGKAGEASVLFIDLTGSTRFAADRDPSEVVDVLNRFFGVVVQEVDAHHGLVNKFMGDAVLAIFGAPVSRDGHAALALAAARRMAERLHEEVPEIGFGVGVATGRVVAGYVGHETRFEYTVIGDAVNAASRITDLAKTTESGVLADEAAIVAAGESEARFWSAHSTTTLRGRPAESRLLTLAH